MTGASSDETGAAEPPVRESGPGEGVSAEPGGSPGGVAGAGSSSDEMGSADTPEPTTERDPPETDPTVRDSGEPADGPADPEGSSGGEQGLNPWAPESYEPEPEGPTTSTEDRD